MKRFDYDSLMEQYMKKYRTSLIVFISLVIVFTLSFVLGVIFSTYENRIILMIVMSIWLAILICFIVWIIIFGLAENKKCQNQLFYILGGYMSLAEGEVVEIKNEITTISGRRGIEVVIKNKDDQLHVFYDSAFGDIPFKVNDYLTIKLSELFIIEYEVKNA